MKQYGYKMIKPWKFLYTVGMWYLAIVTGLWGFVEGYTYFKGEQLKRAVGSYWLLFLYGIPLLFAFGIAVIIVKQQRHDNKVQPQELDSNSISLYPHNNPPYNAVKMLYTGTEIAKDFRVAVDYKNSDGEHQIREIQDFFPEQDHQLIWKHYKYDHLTPNQVIYFRLPLIKTVPDKKVKILISFIGAISGTHIEAEKEFDLSY